MGEPTKIRARPSKNKVIPRILEVSEVVQEGAGTTGPVKVSPSKGLTGLCSVFLYLCPMSVPVKRGSRVKGKCDK